MILKELKANNPSFHTVKFKEGLNFIIGKRENPLEKNLQNTYNGVGKSLIIELVHFCFGSKKNDVFKEQLKGWSFTLDFKIDNKDYSVMRSCDDQTKVIFNGKKISVSNYTALLLDLVFGLNKEKKYDYMTFRSLISRFLRRDKSSYNRYDKFLEKETDYGKLINNAYLLGLDVDLIENKMKTKKKINELENTKKTVEKDPILKSYFADSEDLDIEIIDLAEKIRELEKDLKDFRVTENYKEIQREADELSYKKRDLENQRVLIQNSLKKINKSLSIRSEIDLNTVINLYREAKEIFEEKVVKHLNQVTDFHEKLLKSRKKRLEAQKYSFEIKKTEIEKEIDTISIEINELLKFLGSHGALEEYGSLSEKLNEYKIKLDKATDYKKLLDIYEDELSQGAIAIETQKLEASRYIKENKDLLLNIMETFRTYSKKFYRDKASGLDIKVNDGINQLRFDIKAKIIGDSSDGISEVCIFCFDMTLMSLNPYNVNFIFHDSRLFSNMDPRQRLSLLKIVEQETAKSDVQYIASLNEDMISTLKDVTDEEDFLHFKKVIEENTVLSLTDRSEKEKLLGFNVDLPYNK